MTGAPDFWNIPAGAVTALYAIAVVAMAVFVGGFWYRARLWASGRDSEDGLKGLGTWGLIALSFRKLLSSDCFFARRVFPRGTVKAIVLVGIMWSFAALFVGTLSRTVNYYLFDFLNGELWLIFSATLDLAGLFLLIGVVYGLLRRYVWKAKRTATSIQDGLFLVWLLLVILTGFLVEGVRLAVTRPPAFDWSPVGYAFGASLSAAFGGSVSALKELDVALWLTHMFLALSFIAYIPFSKGFHLFASQITTYLASEKKRSLAKAVDRGLEID